jgi:hypothetical protein
VGFGKFLKKKHSLKPPGTSLLMSMISANQEIYKLLKDGVKVQYRGMDSSEIWNPSGIA